MTEIIERIYKELEVLRALDEPKSMADLQQKLDWPAMDVREIMRCLGEKDTVAIVDGHIERRSTTI